MSNFGLFNFNISKSTPTTSTTHANTTSLPLSAASKIGSMGTKSDVLLRETFLVDADLHKNVLEEASKAGSASRPSATSDHTSSPSNAPSSRNSDEHTDLMHLLGKFKVEVPNTPQDVDSLEEKFDQFKPEKQPSLAPSASSSEIDSRTLEFEATEKPKFSEEHEAMDSVTTLGLEENDSQKVVVYLPTAGNKNPENAKQRITNPAPEQDLVAEATTTAVAGHVAERSNLPPNLDNTSMTIQPHVMEEAIKTIDEKVPDISSTSMFANPNSEKESDGAVSPLVSSNDIFSVDNGEPIVEVQLEISEKETTANELQNDEAPFQRTYTPRKDSIINASKSVVNAKEQHQQSHRPFDFQTFLSHLRNKSALPIIRYIRSFLMSFAKQSSTMSASQMMKATRNFKVFIEDKFREFEPFASMDENDIENSVEGVEKLIMNRLYEFCFAPEAFKKYTLRPSSAMSKDLLDDNSFKLQMEKFSWVLGAHLDVDLVMLSEKKKNASGDNIDYMEYAGNELNRINDYRAPRDKIICILNSCKILFGLLRVNSQETNADAFMPLLILVILKAKTDYLISNLHYIERFRGEKWLNHGETSYYLSTIQGAMNFIQGIKKEDLTIDQDHFDAHMEAWEAELRQRGFLGMSPIHQVTDGDKSEANNQKRGMLPSNVLAASAGILTKSISTLLTHSEENSTASSVNERQPEPEYTEAQVDEILSQLSEIFPSLDREIMRDIILMNKANFDSSLDVCLQLVNDD